MAGETPLVLLCGYLSRLRGETVSAEQPLTLRSVERAAFASWIRKSNLAIRTDLLASSVPFSVTQLLSRDGTPPLQAAVPEQAAAPGRLEGPVAAGRVGIDIETVDALPLAEDYREHPFYRDHFTEREISYCLRQHDVRASFCGTWAAKEAILKSGLGQLTDMRFSTIEILRDDAGRPTFPKCSISISHTPSTAIAVCLGV